MIGRQIGNYRIDAEQGRGAMGVVYRATDLRLGRRAILKFLAPELVAQSRARQRFEREARAASALDHANICTVYQIGEAPTPDGRRQVFIAMAYYDGETLSRKIRRGPMTPDQVADLIRQIAQGLDAAHRHGVIHRDIKAANIIVTHEGVAKILDFGLAKLQGLPDPSTDNVVGTPAYLAPEILRGQEAAASSDLFSLATLAYEMLTGHVPFAEFRGPALLNALLNREPIPPSKTQGFGARLGGRASKPVAEAVDRVILQGLSKEPAVRQQDVLAFARDLRRALGLPDVGTGDLPSAPSTRGTRSMLAVGWAVGALLLAGLLWWGREHAPLKALDVLQTAPLTRGAGLEKSAAFSPDGKRLTFASDQLGNLDIWVRSLGSNQTVPLTADHEGYDDFPVFSPDGQWIAFVSDRQGGGIFIMSALGGPPRRVFSLPFIASQESPIWVPTLDFSPDGRHLMVSEILSLGGPWLVDVETGAAETIPKPSAVVDIPLSQPTFSPRRPHVVMVAVAGTGTTVSTLWLLDLETDRSRPLTSGEHLDQHPRFSPDGRRLFFVSNRGGSFDLWTLDLDGIEPDGDGELPQPESLTTGIGLGYPALAPDGRSLIYSQLEETSNIWTFTLGDQAAELDDAKPLTRENHLIEFVHPSSDGEWLVFDSNRSGNVDLWLMPRRGGPPERLTHDPTHDFCPRFSPNDREIAFYSLRSGNRDLWVLSRDDGSVRSLAPHPSRDWMPQWSPDGRWIFYESSRSGNRDLWRVPADGAGEPEQLTFHAEQDTYPVPSPDGRYLAFASSRTGSAEVHVLDLETREVRRLSNRGTFSVLLPFSWSEDGSEIYAQAREAALRAPNLWAFRVADGSARPRTDFRSARLQIFESLTVRRGEVFFPVRERHGDLWIAELGFE